MGAGGRPKKPTNIRVLEGNPGHRTIKPEVKPAPIMPDKPKLLKGEASDEWDRISVKLERIGLLTEIDGTALAAYCQAYKRWCKFEAEIDAHEKANGTTTYTISNGSKAMIPQVNAAANMMKIMAMYLAKFGLSPSDRAGLSVNAGSGGGKMKGLLSGGE